MGQSGAGGLSYEDLMQIVDLIESSSRFTEFHLKVGEIELDIRRGPAPPAGGATPAGTPPPPPAVHSTPAVPAAGHESRHASPLAYPEGAVLVKSPMVGTFYRAPEPGAKPFVEVGSAVSADSIVGIVEVMKLMNSIAAGSSGIVTHLLVEDGQPVQYGQVLAVVEPGPAP